MIHSDTFDLDRVRRYLERHPDSEIIIIANKKDTANEYWKRIKSHLGIEHRPFIISNARTWDGLPFMDSLVLKISNWWENRNAADVMFHTIMAKCVLPITHIPVYVKGGD